ncbi:MAG: hypothetical protein IKV00_08040 [Clostridia bacterium]|nr:hypothetical protein [Clostridia bacterium]
MVEREHLSLQNYIFIIVYYNSGKKASGFANSLKMGKISLNLGKERGKTKKKRKNFKKGVDKREKKCIMVTLSQSRRHAGVAELADAHV